MKSINMQIIKQNMLMTSELLNIVKLLKKYDIDLIAFKGPTLSQMAYGNISLRQYVDLDIFINKKDTYIIQDLMFKNNYNRSLELGLSQEKIWFKYAHDIGFKNQINGTNIEFHWSMLDTDHPVSLLNMDFFDDKKNLQLNNIDIPIVSNEKFLVYLCIHGSKHMFERVEWVVDIDKFIKNQKLDWNKILDIVEKDNSIKFFILGLYMSNLLYHTPIDERFEKYFDADIKTIAEYIFSCWNKDNEFNTKNNLKFMIKLFISRSDKLQYLHKIYLKPTFVEYWYISFPEPLYFLYYPLRQYLLIKKYLFSKIFY